MRGSILKSHQVSRSFGHVRAVNRLTLEFQGGEILTLLGWRCYSGLYRGWPDEAAAVVAVIVMLLTSGVALIARLFGLMADIRT